MTAPTKLAAVPLEPLWNLARSRSGLEQSAEVSSANVGFNSTVFASLCNTSTKAVGRWKKDKAIPWSSADSAACALGVHPSEVWGDDWSDVKGDLAEIASGAFDVEIDRALEAVTPERIAEVARQEAEAIAEIRRKAIEARMQAEQEQEEIDDLAVHAILDLYEDGCFDDF